MGKTELDLTRYFELLAKKEQLKSEGKNLDKEDWRELLEWQVIFSQEIRFRERNQYLELLKNYLEENIDTGVFCSGFLRLWYQHRDSFSGREEELRQNSVSTIWVDSRAAAFASLVNHLFCFDESFGDDYDDDYDEDLLEEEYRKEIQEIYLKMKEILEQE